MKWMLLAAALTIGCGNSGFDRPSEVRGPRILAVLAEPADAAPGEDLELRAVIGNPNADSLELRWSIDLSTPSLAASAGQQLEGEEVIVRLQGERAVLPGEETEAAVSRLLAAVEGFAPGTPEHVVRTVYERVGLTAVVRLAMHAPNGDLLLEADKRVFLSPRLDRTRNPPPPRFFIDGRVAMTADEPTSCVVDGGPLAVAPAREIELRPHEDESWLETYPTLGLNGEAREGVEAAYYSWFATAGEFSSNVTRVPSAAVTWTAPDEPGPVSIWLVVRDGHLGVSACRTEIVIED